MKTNQSVLRCVLTVITALVSEFDNAKTCASCIFVIEFIPLYLRISVLHAGLLRSRKNVVNAS